MLYIYSFHSNEIVAFLALPSLTLSNIIWGPELHGIFIISKKNYQKIIIISLFSLITIYDVMKVEYKIITIQSKKGLKI